MAEDSPIYYALDHALGKIAYQEHYSDNISSGYVVFGQVHGTSFTYNTCYLEQIAERHQAIIIKAIQKAEHCKRNVSFLNTRVNTISINAVKLLEVILK